MKGIIFEQTEDKLIVLIKGGKFIEIDKPHYPVDIGQKITISTHRKNTKQILQKFISAAAVFMLLMTGAYGVYGYYTPQGYINIDINPSIEMAYNLYGKPIKLRGLNEDGKKVIKKMGKFPRKSIENVVDKIIEAAVEEKFIAKNKENIILITITELTKKMNNQNLDNTIQHSIQERKIQANTIVMKANKTTYQDAKKQGVSPGKLILMNKIVKQKSKDEINNMKKKSVKQIIQIINQHQKSQYGSYYTQAGYYFLREEKLSNNKSKDPQNKINHSDQFTSIWSRQQAHNFILNENNTAPHINQDFELAAPDLWVWDTWPLLNRDGSLANVKGYRITFALVAPRTWGWNDRHFHAKIGMFYTKNGKDWTYAGIPYAYEKAFGYMQWAGSSMLDEKGKVHLFYTATGNNKEVWDEIAVQRIAKTTFDIGIDKDGVHLTNEGEHKIILEADGKYYESIENWNGNIITAFRDPFFFQDPNTGKEYILFEGQAGSDTNYIKPENIGDEEFRKTHPVPAGAEVYNGNIGIAEVEDKELTKFKLLPPLVESVGVNHQLERPHIVVKGNKYYLFTDTHKFTYAPGLDGPDGLYGFVGDSIRSHYKPLNGNGLVISNPPDDPYQAYSWYVMPNGEVLSFINEYRSHGEIQYGGTFAPTLKLDLRGDKTKITGVLENGQVISSH